MIQVVSRPDPKTFDFVVPERSRRVNEVEGLSHQKIRRAHEVQ